VFRVSRCSVHQLKINAFETFSSGARTRALVEKRYLETGKTSAQTAVEDYVTRSYSRGGFRFFNVVAVVAFEFSSKNTARVPNICVALLHTHARTRLYCIFYTRKQTKIQCIIISSLARRFVELERARFEKKLNSNHIRGTRSDRLRRCDA